MLSSWLVEGSSDSYTKADSNFLPIFNSSISDLPPGAPDLYLAIKTQKTIEALIVKSSEKETGGLIAECMTSGLEGKVRSQHEDQELTAADQAFLTVVRARQEELQAETKDAIDQGLLPHCPVASIGLLTSRSCAEKEVPGRRSIAMYSRICQDATGRCLRHWAKVRRAYRISVRYGRTTFICRWRRRHGNGLG